jgi:capsular exopolysaccharide synthesis family protein
MRASNIRVVDPAVPASTPYRPDFPLNIMAGTLASSFLGLALVTWRQRRDHSIREPGETGSYLNTIELAAVPSNPTRNGAWVRAQPFENAGSVSGKNGELALTRGHDSAVSRGEYALPLLSVDGERSLFAESFRSAAASILYSSRNGDRTRVLVVTSVNTGEGKTTVACNLSIMLARLTRRTLLVDGDIRRPRIHDVFGLDNETGITSVLSRTGSIEIPALLTSIENLEVLPSGPLDNPELLYSARLTELVEAARGEFEFVVIDAPPVLQMPDARVLGRCADGIILVVRANQTSLEAAMLARQRFAEDGTRIVGTILNNWDPAASAAHPYINYRKGYENYYNKV